MPLMASHVLVVDNGAWELKAGLADAKEPSLVMPNCVIKSHKRGVKQLLVGDQTASVREAATLYRRAFERGYLTDWGLERRVWDRMLSADGLGVATDARRVDLVCTVPPAQPRRLLEDLAQMAFEEYRFASLFAPSAAAMAQWDPKLSATQALPRGCVVVDAGYSHCHIVPCYEGTPVNHATGRLDVAGKALTNYLKVISVCVCVCCCDRVDH